METIKAKIGAVHTFDLSTKSHNVSIIKKEITDIINNFGNYIPLYTKLGNRKSPIIIRGLLFLV